MKEAYWTSHPFYRAWGTSGEESRAPGIGPLADLQLVSPTVEVDLYGRAKTKLMNRLQDCGFGEQKTYRSRRVKRILA